MQTYEVEIKALLGSSERADKIRQKMKALDPTCKLEPKNKQRNHYFEGGDLKTLAEYFAPQFPEESRVRFLDLVKRAKTSSVRTREKDGPPAGGVFLVVKASVDDTTSENGIARIEFEEKVQLTLDELDKLVLASGFAYQAKWSREREEYVCRGTNVTLDKNAGYGWLAEFERVVTNEEELEKTRDGIRALMRELNVEELPQDRLERMFAYYNEHWPEYYGTEKVFVVE